MNAIETPGTGKPAAAPTMLEVEVGRAPPGARLLLPTGIATPHDEVLGVSVEGGEVEEHVAAAGLGLGALLVRPTSRPMVLRYRIGPSATSAYPEIAFALRRTRHTTAAEELAGEARSIAAAAGGGEAGIAALAEDARSRFDYGHPEARFNDGHETVPLIACGRAAGSCVDINTYLVASLRAAGYEAAYLYGYFFPAERGGITNDMHCWVVTRHAGRVLEWDVAHHMKAGLAPVRPALDPKPGRRVALGHSMGQRYRLADATIDLKLLAEPVWIMDGVAIDVVPLLARLRPVPATIDDRTRAT